MLLILMRVVLTPANPSRMEQGWAAFCLAWAPGAAQPRYGEDGGPGELAVHAEPRLTRREMGMWNLVSELAVHQNSCREPACLTV